jgi:hypothetical protein
MNIFGSFGQCQPQVVPEEEGFYYEEVDDLKGDYADVKQVDVALKVFSRESMVVTQ